MNVEPCNFVGGRCTVCGEPESGMCNHDPSESQSLHQQAQALAKQIAHRLNNHWADDTSVPDVIALIVPTLQRVQAETREEDAKRAEDYLHLVPTDPSEDDRLDKVARYSNATVQRIAAAIRAERIVRDE